MTISPRIAVSCALAVDWLIVFMARQSVALFAAFVRSCSFTAVPFPLLMPPSLPPWLVLCALRCSAVLAVLSLDLLAVLTALAYLLCLLCCPLLAVLLRCCAHLHFLTVLCSLRCARCAVLAVLTVLCCCPSLIRSLRTSFRRSLSHGRASGYGYFYGQVSNHHDTKIP